MLRVFGGRRQLGRVESPFGEPDFTSVTDLTRAGKAPLQETCQELEQSSRWDTRHRLADF